MRAAMARGELRGRRNSGIVSGTKRQERRQGAARRGRRSARMHVGLATGFAHQGGRSGPDAEFVREEIEHLLLAEELGFESVWMTEHHCSDYSMSNDPMQRPTYHAAKNPTGRLGRARI